MSWGLMNGNVNFFVWPGTLSLTSANCAVNLFSHKKKRET